MAGEPVNFEFSSADATTAAAITLRSAGGATRTLGSEERFTLIGFTGSIAAAVINAVIFSDDDADGNLDAGELMAVMGLGSSNGSALYQAATKGITPKVKAANAGQIYLAGYGIITKG